MFRSSGSASSRKLNDPNSSNWIGLDLPFLPYANAYSLITLPKLALLVMLIILEVLRCIIVGTHLIETLAFLKFSTEEI